MNVSALYTRDILLLAANLQTARLEAPDASVSKKSRICGSSVTVDVKFEGDRVAALGAAVEACALGQASLAILQKNAAGRDLKEIRAVKDALSRLLTGEDVRFPEAWAELSVFSSARTHKGRHSAILLPFQALAEAFGKSK